MALKFGTSGVRGLVSEMTDRECIAYTRAFIHYLRAACQSRGRGPTAIYTAGDLRSSTPRILKAVAFAIQREGLNLQHCGCIPTPALIHYAMQADQASIMVTGSHIPDDRNGIKFNLPWGEVLKDDEHQITLLYNRLRGAPCVACEAALTADGMLETLLADQPLAQNDDGCAQRLYAERYASYFEPGCLKDLRVVFYEHSSAARDIAPPLLEALGARVIKVGRSNTFIPVDTEAVEDTEQLQQWIRESVAHGLVSTDGDGDRPLVVDEKGSVIRGDVLGMLCADFLQADSIVTPVSSNTAVERCGRFAVERTRIGSPYVVAAMADASRKGRRRVVGYEANGGFFTASEIPNAKNDTVLRALPTRDALLPILACLAMAAERGALSSLAKTFPARFTASGIVRHFPLQTARRILDSIRQDPDGSLGKHFVDEFGPVGTCDFTDGARMVFASGDIVHLRPSGNAPEFRCYTESISPQQAQANNRKALQLVVDVLQPEIEP